MSTNASIREKIGLLKRVDLFSRLNQEELEVVAFHSEFVAYRAGAVIFTEHADAQELYVIREGSVLITRQSESHQDIDLAQFIAGEYFGEMDFLGDVPRDATALATGDTVLLVFPRAGTTFANVINRYPIMSALILYKVLAMISVRIRTAHQLITEKSPWIESLRRTLMVDKLTGLYNRHYFDEDFTAVLAAEREMSLLMIKPDNFKDFNDRFGHEAGDRILIMMAIFIGAALRERDLVVRYHGDEFAVVLAGTGGREGVAMARELGRAIWEIDTTGMTGGLPIRMSVSIGVATYPDPCADGRELVESARERMYRARARGGNRITVS